MKPILLAVVGILLLAPLAFGMPGIRQWRAVWNPNTEPDLAGYKLYWRQPGSTFSDDSSVDCGAVTTRSIMDLGLTAGIWEFALTAYDTSGNESGFSEVVSHPFDPDAPGSPINLELRSNPGVD